MNVVAEGVETQDQLARLAAMGCASGQGYYFSKPVDAERAHWLIQGKDTPQRGILLKPVPRIGRAKPPESYDFEPALAG
jgi:predicted signal transduction protein with EAL and GGDEF domain